MKKQSQYFHHLAVCALGTFFAAAAFAGPVAPSKQTAPAPEPEVPLNIINLLGEQTFQSDFKHGAGFDEDADGNNKTNTWHYAIEAARRFQLNDHWYFRLGIDATRYDFGDNRSIAPNTLQGYGLELALEYFQHGKVGFFIQTKPGLYFSHDITGQDFDAPTNVAFAYPLFEEKVFLIAGVHVCARVSNYPILPIGGVLWHINDRWDLQAYLPNPRFVYQYSDSLQVWGGAEFTGGSFLSDSSYDKSISRKPVDYYEVRVGAGVAYKLCKASTLDLSAGEALVRNWRRGDETVKTDPAPYLNLAINTEF